MSSPNVAERLSEIYKRQREIEQRLGVLLEERRTLQDEYHRLREEELRLRGASEPDWCYHSDDAD